ncbi:hypothetical protein GWL_24950 [Herbaspirillum sp. GW103]|nr:hypothetical protein GWL_24950 [Herbaspirillum sp. GW103]
MRQLNSPGLSPSVPPTGCAQTPREHGRTGVEPAGRVSWRIVVL